MINDLTIEELSRLRVDADPETGRIFVDGREATPRIFKTPKGYTYPQISVYDPHRWTAKHYGNRPIFAARIVWAVAYGVCRGDEVIRPINGDPFDIRVSNLESKPRRGSR